MRWGCSLNGGESVILSMLKKYSIKIECFTSIEYKYIGAQRLSFNCCHWFSLAYMNCKASYNILNKVYQHQSSSDFDFFLKPFWLEETFENPPP